MMMIVLMTSDMSVVGFGVGSRGCFLLVVMFWCSLLLLFGLCHGFGPALSVALLYCYGLLWVG